MTQIMIDRALVEQVLETIEGLTRDRLFTAEWAGKHGATIAALRAVLAQQAEPVEPVAWSGYDLDGMVEAFSRVIEAHHSSKHPFHDPIDTDAKMALRILRGLIPAMKAYAAPPQLKPLTDEEIYDMYNEPRSDAEMVAFARAVERAHGIGGQP
jgi:hypothetical protein